MSRRDATSGTPSDRTAHAPSRRAVLGVGAGMSVAPLVAGAGPAVAPTAGPATAGGTVPLVLRVNGRDNRLTLDPRTSLLDALREHLQLTGSKKGCDHGQCGACTVHLDGKRVLACLTLALAAEGHEVTTIESLGGPDGKLHPMQAAFIEADGFQCGYCTPGQIMSAVACVNEGRAGSGDEIREFMSGNLCRCGAYPNIVKAVQAAKAEMERG